MPQPHFNSPRLLPRLTTCLVHLILVHNHTTPHYTMYPQPHFDLASLFTSTLFPSCMQVHMGQTARQRSHTNQIADAPPLPWSSLGSCRGSMASPHVCLVGRAARVFHRQRISASPANFCCSTQATPGVSDPARRWVWISSDITVGVAGVPTV